MIHGRVDGPPKRLLALVAGEQGMDGRTDGRTAGHRRRGANAITDGYADKSSRASQRSGAGAVASTTPRNHVTPLGRPRGAVIVLEAPLSAARMRRIRKGLDNSFDDLQIALARTRESHFRANVRNWHRIGTLLSVRKLFAKL